MIEAAIQPVRDEPAVFCSNVIEPIDTVEEFYHPNTIKVTMDALGNALYFSRQPIPHMGHRLHDGFACGLAYKQVCIIPFRRENLQRFLLLPSTPLEQAESIDMLRILEHGHTVRLVQTPHRTQAVDAPEDIMTVERMMHEDAVCLTY
jgi:3-deoxy-manno-octulosonate cytidylyltransferase (CMP-KDO synthetase)